MRLPECAKQVEQPLRQGHIAIASALAEDYMHDHARTVDVCDAEERAFAEPKPADVDGGEAGAVSVVANGGKDAPSLLASQYHRKAVLTRGAHDVEDAPFVPQGLLEEELDPT